MAAGLLEGKVAIVTGAAEGMGEATARLFAAHGARVVLADFNAEIGESTTASINAEGGEASFVKTDVSQASEVEAMVQAAVGRYGRLDCAVNNAGTSPDNEPLSNLIESEWDRVINVNLKGVALCLKYELSQIQSQGGGGAVVNIASVSGFRPQPNNAAYNASKHGVIGLTKTASLESAPLGVRVNAVAPGGIDTPMMRRAFEATGWTEADFAPVISLIGNRLGRPDEVAQASLWLCSDLASYVTGVTLPVDAGFTSR
jgi:NAD(P)-dependent dehydrogenase (short-subunit alcohol dehydrogenase family)